MFLSKKSLRQQHGGALTIAIVTLVLGGLLVAGLLRLFGASSDAIVAEVSGARAYQTASSGAELYLSDLFADNSVNASSCPAGDTTDVLFLDGAGAGLQNCSATVQCRGFDTDTDGVSNFFRIVSTGECQVGERRFSRQLTVEAGDG